MEKFSSDVASNFFLSPLIVTGLKKEASKDEKEDPIDVKMQESGETKDDEDLVQRMQDSPFNLESPLKNGTKV